MLQRHIVIHVVMVLKKEYRIQVVDVKMDGGMMEVNVDLVYNHAQNVNQKLFVLGVIVILLDFMLTLMVYVKIVFTRVLIVQHLKFVYHVDGILKIELWIKLVDAKKDFMSVEQSVNHV